MPFLRDLRIAIRSLSRVPAVWFTVALTLATILVAVWRAR